MVLSWKEEGGENMEELWAGRQKKVMGESSGDRKSCEEGRI